MPGGVWQVELDPTRNTMAPQTFLTYVASKAPDTKATMDDDLPSQTVCR